MNGIPSIWVVTGDLFFRAKIETTAAALDAELEILASATELSARIESGDRPRLVLIDLGGGPDAGASEPAAAIRELKALRDPPRVVAFGPHREVERFTAAREAGADQVLARSAFTARLPDLLRSAKGSAD